MILAKVKLFVFLSDPTNDHSLLLAQRAGEQPTVDEFGAYSACTRTHFAFRSGAAGRHMGLGMPRSSFSAFVLPVADESTSRRSSS
jgi:hypothetical protein